MVKISVVIPAFNEEDNISRLIDQLFMHGGESLAEVIVVDGKSHDNTLEVAQNAGAVALQSPQKGRATQMNYGASHATGDILYFVHADVLVHPGFATDIPKAISAGYDLGCYRFEFDSKKWLLKINAWFTRLPFLWCRGGDQTLFVKKSLFRDLKGFREDYQIMEDFDFIKRAKRKYRFRIIPKNIVVSARKYRNNSYFKVQMANYAIVQMWKKGAPQQEMVDRYREMLDYGQGNCSVE